LSDTEIDAQNKREVIRYLDRLFSPEYLCRVVTRQNQRREAAVRAAQAMQRIVEQ
jgi:hypothetical protein